MVSAKTKRTLSFLGSKVKEGGKAAFGTAKEIVRPRTLDELKGKEKRLTAQISLEKKRQQHHLH